MGRRRLQRLHDVGRYIYNDAVFALASMAAAVALASLFVLLRGAFRWVGMAAAIGAAAQGVGNSVEHCVAEPFFLVYVAGALTFALASCVLAAGLLVTGQLGRWPGLMLGAAALGLMFLGSERGGVAVTGCRVARVRSVARQSERR